MTRLLLIRHGETDWNRARLIQGSTDIPLNDTGREQARGAALLLRDALAGEPAVVAASDLQRAQETGSIVAAELGLPAPWTTPLLRERSYGEAEGMSVDEYHRRFDGAEAVPGAETDAELNDRALRGIREAIGRARRETGASGGALVVATHGGLIRAVISRASGGAFPAPGERIANGSVHEVLVERDRIRLLSYSAV
ncbi:histidine phosphatase family protein [Microbacterium sp. SORGH_AS_0888]|uniref:histidine phosphatase family protein n=1 Tax=Microbacterium sp. SORGH_AS_0888 TaxID=3041791 RepID=UPI002787579C|nr:histidine phosphatase family protein [Microbacterium sp. SORGH_AS_0888]MDQ1128447.1 broad specificity phosphatase PhoE [Microbacterium sp. SORGH_AS_0888]